MGPVTISCSGFFLQPGKISFWETPGMPMIYLGLRTTLFDTSNAYFPGMRPSMPGSRSRKGEKPRGKGLEEIGSGTFFATRINRVIKVRYVKMRLVNLWD
jgi:hypothetical protein